MCSKHPFEACYGSCQCTPQPGETWFYSGNNVKIIHQEHRHGKVWVHYQRGQVFGCVEWAWMQHAGAVRVSGLPRGTVTGRTSGVYDEYTLRAAGYYGVHPSRVTSEQRQHGRRLVLSEVYGAAPKPPLGVKSRNLHDEERANALDEAIVRYLNEDLPVPIEWVQEFNELRTRLNRQEA